MSYDSFKASAGALYALPFEYTVLGTGILALDQNLPGNRDYLPGTGFKLIYL
jgi:hypothetical protein